MPALRISERTWLRVASRTAATFLVLGSAALLLLERQPVVAAPSGPAAVSVSMVSWSRPALTRAERRIAPPPEQAAPQAMPVSTPEPSAGGGASALWFDGAQGRVAFRDGAHYLRCLDAQLERRDEPDCPPVHDFSDDRAFDVVSSR